MGHFIHTFYTYVYHPFSLVIFPNKMCMLGMMLNLYLKSRMNLVRIKSS